MEHPLYQWLDYQRTNLKDKTDNNKEWKEARIQLLYKIVVSDVKKQKKKVTNIDEVFACLEEEKANLENVSGENNELPEEIAKLKKEIEELKKKLENVSEENNKLRKENAKLEEEKANVGKEKANVGKEKANLENVSEENNKLRKEIAKLKEEKEELKKDKKKLENAAHDNIFENLSLAEGQFIDTEKDRTIKRLEKEVGKIKFTAKKRLDTVMKLEEDIKKLKDVMIKMKIKF